MKQWLECPPAKIQDLSSRQAVPVKICSVGSHCSAVKLLYHIGVLSMTVYGHGQDKEQSWTC